MSGLGELRGIRRPSSLAAEAEARIRQELLDTGATPNLTEVEVARRFGMSRTPVREALHHLAILGVIEPSAAGGYAKRQYSARDVREHYALRILLEVEAAGLAAGRTPAERVLLADGPGFPRTPTDESPGNAGSIGFHRSVGDLSGNAVLSRVITLLNERSLSLALYASASRLAREHLDDGHGAIRRAIEEGDASVARAEMHRHLEAVRDAILEQLATARQETP